MGAKCVGFDAKKVGLKENCANCKNWDGKCLVQKLLNELYEESTKFRSMDSLMRSNKGVFLG